MLASDHHYGSLGGGRGNTATGGGVAAAGDAVCDAVLAAGSTLAVPRFGAQGDRAIRWDTAFLADAKPPPWLKRGSTALVSQPPLAHLS